MQAWLDTITIGQAVAWIGGITAAIITVIPGVRLVAGIVQGARQFLEDWNGVPPRKDRAGKVIDPGKPGIPAQLERVRRQVENDHDTNFREDLDKATKTIDNVSKKLDEHIVISKHHDREQTKTQRALDKHIDSTQRWTVMLEDLHDEWSENRKDPGPE